MMLLSTYKYFLVLRLKQQASAVSLFLDHVYLIERIGWLQRKLMHRVNFSLTTFNSSSNILRNHLSNGSISNIDILN